LGENQDLLREADAITDHVRAIRLILKRPIVEAIAAGGLTAPQVGVLRALVLAGGEGLSLKDLSSQLGLAHSTVSGIVDRLERRGLARRVADEADRRVTRIVPSDEVRSYVKSGAALHHPTPLVEGLCRASTEERSRIKDGLETLRRLLESGGSPRRNAPGTPPG
jgi:DNA-binding MarR family transcriptional regulator